MKDSKGIELNESLTILYQEVRSALRVYRGRRKLLAKRKLAEAFIERVMKTGKPMKVELAGYYKRKEMEDWIVTDIEGKADIALDLLEPFPFPEGSVDCVYSSHVLEHFRYPNQMQHVLGECRRILRPDGVFSIAVPDARYYINFYLNQEQEIPQQFFEWNGGLKFNSRIDMLNFVAYLGDGEHKHMFDRDSLVKILEEAGFKDVKLRDHNSDLDPEWRRFDSIYAVGMK